MVLISEGAQCADKFKMLWILLKEISPAALRQDLNIATGTMT